MDKIIEYCIYFVVIPLIGLGLLSFISVGLKNNDITFIYHLISYSLTLAGFTLVGGVFEKKKASEIKIKLLESSKFFILAALLFISGISLASIEGDTVARYFDPWYLTASAGISIVVGLLIFVIGFIHLVRYLCTYRTTSTKSRK